MQHSVESVAVLVESFFAPWSRPWAERTPIEMQAEYLAEAVQVQPAGRRRRLVKAVQVKSEDVPMEVPEDDVPLDLDDHGDDDDGLLTMSDYVQENVALAWEQQEEKESDHGEVAEENEEWPNAEMAMVVGKYKVPIKIVSLPDATGSFVEHKMVEFSQRQIANSE